MRIGRTLRSGLLALRVSVHDPDSGLRPWANGVSPSRAGVTVADEQNHAVKTAGVRVDRMAFKAIEPWVPGLARQSGGAEADEMTSAYSRISSLTSTA